MKQILAVVLALAFTPAVTPSPAPAKPVHVMIWQQVQALEQHDAKTTNDFSLFVLNYEKFGATVYAPWCATDGGVATVKLDKPFTAWPAHVYCKNDSPKGPGRLVEAPKP